MNRQAFFKIFSILLVGSFLLYAFRPSKEVSYSSIPHPKPPPIENSNDYFFQINDLKIDFTFANQNFTMQFMKYIKNSTIPHTIYPSKISTKRLEKIDLPDILVTTQNIDSNYLLNASSYLIFQDTEELFKFTFDFVDNNRQFTHLIPPIIEVDNFTHINLHYFNPQIILLKRAEKKFHETIDSLWELQHPKDCNKTTFARINDQGCGLGCAIHWIHQGFHMAYQKKRPFAVPGYQSWAYNSPECGQDYRCLFMTIPLGCIYDDATSPHERVEVHHNFEPGQAELDLRSAIHFFGLKLNAHTFLNLRATYDYFDTLSKHQFLPCISVHIRRGDKALEAPPKPIEAYTATVRNLTLQYPGNWSIFVLSDDFNAAADFDQEISKNFPVYHSNTTEMRSYDTYLNYFKSLDAITEVYLAAACDHFVGTFSSNLGRLIHEVKNSLKQRTTTTSLDAQYVLLP